MQSAKARGGGKVHVQNDISGNSYVDAVLELRVDKASEIWTSLLHNFTKEGLLQLPGLVRVCLYM